MTEEKGNSEDKLLFCSFCGKNQNDVRKLIAGPSVYICNECVDLCNDIIQEEAVEYIDSFIMNECNPQFSEVIIIDDTGV